MLVDLGRNDLGRVCEYGSVAGRVVHGRRDLLARDPHRVLGRRARCARTSVRSTRCARRSPPARCRGAPKVRAMEIIDELEPVKRGAYGGAVGWLSYDGDLDTCICIRTVVVKDGVAHVQAGGGTVADAQPDYEYEESRAKARGVVRAIELAAAAGGVAVRVLDGRQLRLVHLQPRPVPGRAGRRAGARCATTRRRSTTCCGQDFDRVVVSPGPCTPNEAGHVGRGHAPLPGGGDPGARRLPRPPVARAGVRRPRGAPRAGARQGDRDRARRRRPVRRAAEPAHRRPLPLAGRRPRRCRTASRSPRAAAAS